MPPKLNRETLAQQLQRLLVDYIKEKGLQPGDSLPSEVKLAAEFEVSRPVIREALRLLNGQGMIETSGNRSPVVSRPSERTLRHFFLQVVSLEKRGVIELLEIRRGIEVESARLAAQRHTPEQVAAMKVLVEGMALKLDDPLAYVDLDLAFHKAIAEATHNGMLLSLMESIRDSLKESMTEGLKSRASKSEFDRIQQSHAEILLAISQSNPVAAASAMAVHFDEAITAISQAKS